MGFEVIIVPDFPMLWMDVIGGEEKPLLEVVDFELLADLDEAGGFLVLLWVGLSIAQLAGDLQMSVDPDIVVDSSVDVVHLDVAGGHFLRHQTRAIQRLAADADALDRALLRVHDQLPPSQGLLHVQVACRLHPRQLPQAHLQQQKHPTS